MDVRVARLERRAESDDDTLRSVLRILERMDRRFASLEGDVATLQTDMSAMKADMGAMKADVGAMKTDIATLTTVTDVLALKVAAIESTTSDTNRRVRVRGFDD